MDSWFYRNLLLVPAHSVHFTYACRAAFSPILTLTATAWDPTTFRSLWTVPTALAWPTTSVTAPCVWSTTRVGPRLSAAWEGGAHCRAEGGTAVSSLALRDLQLWEGAHRGTAANHIILAQQWMSKLPKNSIMFYALLRIKPLVFLAIHLVRGREEERP